MSSLHNGFILKVIQQNGSVRIIFSMVQITDHSNNCLSGGVLLDEFDVSSFLVLSQFVGCGLPVIDVDQLEASFVGLMDSYGSLVIVFLEGEVPWILFERQFLDKSLVFVPIPKI